MPQSERLGNYAVGAISSSVSSANSRTGGAPSKPAESIWATSPKHSRLTQYTKSRPSPPADTSYADGHRCAPPETSARSTPIPHLANRLDSEALCAYADRGRYQSKAMCFSYRLDNDGESQTSGIAQLLSVQALSNRKAVDRLGPALRTLHRKHMKLQPIFLKHTLKLRPI